MPFTINVYGPTSAIKFRAISRAQIPSTIDGSVVHDGRRARPRRQDHRRRVGSPASAERVITVDEVALRGFASLYDPPGTSAAEARLVRPYTRADVAALGSLAKATTTNRLDSVPLERRMAREAGQDRRHHRMADGDSPRLGTRWCCRDRTSPCATRSPSSQMSTVGVRVTGRRGISRRSPTALYLARTTSAPAAGTATEASRRTATGGRPLTSSDCFIVGWPGKPGLGPLRLRWSDLVRCTCTPATRSPTRSSAPRCLRSASGHRCRWTLCSRSRGRAMSRTSSFNGSQVLGLPPADTAVLLRTLRMNCLTADYGPLWSELCDRGEFAYDGWTTHDTRLPPLATTAPD